MGVEELGARANYILGRDRVSWKTHVPAYGRVRFDEVYPGISAVFYGNAKGELEHDFILTPGADPAMIRLDVDGAERFRLDSRGNLVLVTGRSTVTMHRPVAHPTDDGDRRSVPVRYAVDRAGRISMDVAAYDASRELVIDPVVSYSTFFGGGGRPGSEDGNDEAISVAVDAAGSAYVVGQTVSFDFPTTDRALQRRHGGGVTDAWIAKFSPDGQSLDYSTYIGGSLDDIPEAVAVDAEGNAYVAGFTDSPDFPVVGALKDELSGRDAFILKLAPDGSALVYSTFLGGSSTDEAYAVAVDPAGRVRVGGGTLSDDFPVANAAQPALAGRADAFVATLAADGRSLLHSTYLGGATAYPGSPEPAGNTAALGVQVGADGGTLVAGVTNATDFPVRNAIQPSLGGYDDAFVARLDASGTVVFATYLGGSDQDVPWAGVKTDRSGNVYVAGSTHSTDFPTRNALQTDADGGYDDAFVTKITADGSSLVYSTYLGGFNPDQAYGIDVDASGRVFVGGPTSAADLPQVDPVQPRPGEFGLLGGSFVAELSADGRALVFSSYFGGDDCGTVVEGLALSAASDIFLVGVTCAETFRTVRPYQPSKASRTDGFVTKISPDSDRDGVADGKDNCPFVPNADQRDEPDHDGVGDVCDPDDDNDSAGDVVDNCPIVPDADQRDDPDRDGTGNACDGDDDNDGLGDTEERERGTDPENADTDRDKLSDGAEVRLHHTDPLDPDTDDDGLADGDEVGEFGTDPLEADSDADGLSDGDEVHLHGSDPLDRDTDGDLTSDGTEVHEETDSSSPNILRIPLPGPLCDPCEPIR